MLFKKRLLKDKIGCGDIFYRHMQISAQEQARVLYVSNDKQGIPHVHYERTLLAGGVKDLQGVRVLALEAFSKDFHINA
ncbi:MAG: hypothetical protein V7750_03920 [Sneathiella sp.]